jgi:hypothetical protein
MKHRANKHANTCGPMDYLKVEDENEYAYKIDLYT